MTQTTALYQCHLDSGAQMVDFAGWNMPIHYGSQINEHHTVRKKAGVFDVSHMCVVDITGTDAKLFLQNLLANDVAKLKQPGQALYSCMLNHDAGILDDLIAYRFSDQDFRLVVNAAMREQDLAWIQLQTKDFEVAIQVRDDFAMVAIQGPEACALAAPCLPDEIQSTASELTVFHSVREADWMVARTGYTGEDGFEVILPSDQVVAFWQQLLSAGIEPCGLGARDTLRLEAGMNLYGTDMDSEVSPLESGLGWTIAWQPEDRQFIGKQALEAIKTTPEHRKKFVGLLLAERGVPRAGQLVFCGDQAVGVVTSGTFSPTMQQGIAMARVSKHIKPDCQVEIRGKRLKATVVKMPFVRNGQILV